MKKTEENSKNNVLQIAGLSIYILVFLMIMVLQITRSRQLSQWMGVLAQLQVLLSVFVVVAIPKKGFTAATVVNILGAVTALNNVFGITTGRGVQISALPGCIVPVSTIIAVIVIHLYYKKILNKNEEISKSYAQIVETNKIIKEKDEKLSYLAYYDILTGLPNRQLFIEKLDETILNKANSPFTVILADLDDFKQINDTYGNNSGDILLCSYADKLKSFCGSTLFLARLGGDEFGIIIPGNMTEANILNYIQKIQNVVSEPIQVDQSFLHTNISFGIASYPTNAVNSSDILKCVDSAIYFAKSNGKNRPCFYSQQ
ncbi:MAG: GGDEF domain-containing protein [Oscillospiraceae bacterium]|nr:GGDEF domain-containing protein [Oscillospiraceae bacterium]